ncbi:MAG: NifB/NifX family molybdenum-iron cluster-binding protein [Candidatus Aminicenantes bacterium]|nr:NifB/NifX family molybdenum-iron cluster-binding protein [Candidatus Aminicenantes bacterium]
MNVLFAVENNAGLDSRLDNRFGRAGYFLIVDTDSETILSTEENKYKNEGHGVGIKTATYVISSGCKVAVGAQPGPKAAAILEQGNVKLIVNETGTVKEVLQRIKDKI